MRYAPALLVLLLAGCSDDSMTRQYAVSRDSAPETIAAIRMPLSMPPSFTVRPQRPGALERGQGDGQPTGSQTSISAGQDALVQAAGPSAPSDVRSEIDQKSGLSYPPPSFVDRLMTWSPPPGYTPVITQGAQGGWLNRMF